MKLIVSDIRKDYNGKAVLKGCSAAFDDHRTCVLMGPNGCGKSTFLRICALLEQPDTGEVAFFSDESPVRQDLLLRRKITLVLARTGIFNTTVFRNVAYGLSIRGIDKKEIEQRAKDALSFVGLEHLRNRHALTLSTGETQRLGIARALAVNPEVLFLDEPTASVDEVNTEIIESIIQNMKKDGRGLVIMTTHDRNQAERLADRLFVIRQGMFEEVPVS